MQIYVRNAHWPFFVYRVNFDNDGHKVQYAFPFKRCNGYAIRIGFRTNHFVSLFCQEDKLYFVFDDLVFDVTDDCWKSRLSLRNRDKYREFQLTKDGLSILEIKFKDIVEKGAITSENHFLVDVNQWLENQEMKENYRCLIKGSWGQSP